jgi:thiol-disulfide isomerase/thioredoxin
LLIKDVVGRYGGKVRFASEDWGTSELATRFGLKRYPVVFVNDILVAQPKDFGGWGQSGGKYAPWREPANQERFQQDLARVIDRALRGELDGAAGGAEVDTSGDIASLPALTFTDLEGARLGPDALAGQVVVVEFWATWCPPCRSTLQWLGEVERQYKDRVTVLAIAVESPEEDVRKLVKTLGLPVYVVMGAPETARPFGDFLSVPVLFVFDGRGKTAAVFHGAPKDLHERADRVLKPLLAR